MVPAVLHSNRSDAPPEPGTKSARLALTNCSAGDWIVMGYFIIFN
jgi:hypothetical protein